MPYKEGQPTLMGFLGRILADKVTETRLFGGPYIRFNNYCTVISFLYESGAILGRARRNKLGVLEKMLVAYDVPKGTYIEKLRDLAKYALDMFRGEVGKEPNTFLEFIRVFKLRSEAGLSLNEAFKADIKGDKRIVKAFDKKYSVELLRLTNWSQGDEGIGFGSSFPELTERMYRNSYEHIDTDLWSEARTHGLAIPEKPEIVSLEEREATVLQMVAAYASEYYPELVDPLDLWLT